MEPFTLVQDGTPVSAEAGVELLGRLPELELSSLLARRGRAFTTFHDLEHASIGVGPEGSGSSYLIRELFMMPDLELLNVKLSNHALTEQAELVADRKLDVAAMVMQEDAELLRHLIQNYNLEIVAPDDLEGLLARHAWLGHGGTSALPRSRLSRRSYCALGRNGGAVKAQAHRPVRHRKWRRIICACTLIMAPAPCPALSFAGASRVAISTKSTLDELMASRDMRNRRLSRAASHVERPARVCVWTGHGKGHGHFYIMNLTEGARNAFRPS